MIVTRTQYAQLCGVTRAAIAARIKAGTIKPVALPVVAGKNETGIDTEVYPPKRLEPGRKARS